MGVILIDTNHIIIIDMEIDSDLKDIWSAVVTVWYGDVYSMAFNKLYFLFLSFFQGIVLPNTSCSDNKKYENELLLECSVKNIQNKS